jgi:hypothetical protein
MGCGLDCCGRRQTYVSARMDGRRAHLPVHSRGISKAVSATTGDCNGTAALRVGRGGASSGCQEHHDIEQSSAAAALVTTDRSARRSQRRRSRDKAASQPQLLWYRDAAVPRPSHCKRHRPRTDGSEIPLPRRRMNCTSCPCGRGLLCVCPKGLQRSSFARTRCKVSCSNVSAVMDTEG